MDEIDRIGRRAADVLRAEVNQRVDAEDALRRLHDEAVTAVIELDRPRTPRHRVVLAVASVATVAILVGGGIALSRHDTSPRLRPSTTTAIIPAPTTPTPTTPTSTTPTSTTPTSTTAITEPSLGDVQQAVVTVDPSTPVLEAEVIFSAAVANTHPWVGAVTASGRVFIGQDVSGATFSEIVDGALVDTGIPLTGRLFGALDERLYALDDLAQELVVWSQAADGSWAVVQRHPVDGDCSFDVQPSGVRCGDVVAPIEPAADASTVQWSNDMQVTSTRGETSNSWNVSLESNTVALGNCENAGCRRYMRADGTSIAWTPILHVGDSQTANLVSLLEPNREPATAWLDCGGGCQTFGSDGKYIYTVGYAEAGSPSIVVRRFAFTDIAAGRSSAPADPTIDALASWPAAPEYTPTLDDVPMMLPPLTGGARYESADDPATYHDFVQTWIGEGPDPAALTIETNIGQAAAQTGEAVDIAPWDGATFAPTGLGYTVLTLEEPSGYVTMWSHGFTRAELLAMARSLHAPTGDLPGWGVGRLPAGLTYVDAGWGLGAASRSVEWTDRDGARFEMWIAHGVPTVFTTPLGPNAQTAHAIEIGGAPGISYQSSDGPSAVIWKPLPDVTIMLASRGDPGGIGHLIDLALATTSVDEATWLSDTTPGTSLDECSSFFC